MVLKLVTRALSVDGRTNQPRQTVMRLHRLTASADTASERQGHTARRPSVGPVTDWPTDRPRLFGDYRTAHGRRTGLQAPIGHL